jgi:hypothetical protein
VATRAPGRKVGAGEVGTGLTLEGPLEKTITMKVGKRERLVQMRWISWPEGSAITLLDDSELKKHVRKPDAKVIGFMPDGQVVRYRPEVSSW